MTNKNPFGRVYPEPYKGDKSNFYAQSSSNIPNDLISGTNPKYITLNRQRISSTEALKAQRQYVMSAAIREGYLKYLVRSFEKASVLKNKTYNKPTPELDFTNPQSRLQQELKLDVVRLSGYVDYLLVHNLLVNTNDITFMINPRSNYGKRWLKKPKPDSFYIEHKLKGSEATGAGPGTILSFTNGEFNPSYRLIYRYLTVLTSTPLNALKSDSLLDTRFVIRVNSRLETTRQTIIALLNSMILVTRPLSTYFLDSEQIEDAQGNINKILDLNSKLADRLGINVQTSLVSDILEPLKKAVYTGQYTDEQANQLYILLDIEPTLFNSYLDVILDTELIFNELANVYNRSANNINTGKQIIDDYLEFSSDHNGSMGIVGDIFSAGVCHLLKAIIELNAQTQGIMDYQIIRACLDIINQGLAILDRANLEDIILRNYYEGINNIRVSIEGRATLSRINDVNNLLAGQFNNG